MGVKFGFIERFEMGYEWSEIFTIPVGEGLGPPVYGGFMTNNRT